MKQIPYTLHHYFSSISISFSYFLSRSTKKKGNMNTTGTAFEMKDTDFTVFESALGS